MREFVSAAFLRVGVEIVWQGSGVNEVGVDARGVLGEAGRVLLAVDISCVPQRHSAAARNVPSPWIRAWSRHRYAVVVARPCIRGMR